MRKPVENILFLFSLAFFGVVGILYTLFCYLLFALPRRFKNRFGREAIRKMFLFYLGMLRQFNLLKIDDSDFVKLDAGNSLWEERGKIFISNHPSLLDAVILISRLPNAVCIMKAPLWKNPILGGARLAGYIRNNSSSGMVRNAAAAIDEGANLLIFPEGTRSPQAQTIETGLSRTVWPFKGGFALISKAALCSVQTVVIESDSQYMEKGSRWWKMPDRLPIHYKIRSGPTFEIIPGETVKEFVQRLENWYKQALNTHAACQQAQGTSSSSPPTIQVQNSLIR